MLYRVHEITGKRFSVLIFNITLKNLRFYISTDNWGLEMKVNNIREGVLKTLDSMLHNYATVRVYIKETHLVETEQVTEKGYLKQNYKKCQNNHYLT